MRLGIVRRTLYWWEDQPIVFLFYHVSLFCLPVTKSLDEAYALFFHWSKTKGYPESAPLLPPFCYPPPSW